MSLTAEEHTILVADDDDNVRAPIVMFLLKLGFKVLEAENGNETLRIYREKSPSLILLDADMPEIDGFGVCREIRAEAKGQDIPIIMVTALQDENSVEKAFDEGASDFVTKPIHWAVLSRRIRNMIESTSARHALRESEARLRRIYNQTPVMLHSITCDGFIVDVSDYWSQHLGYDRDEIIGKPISDILFEDQDLLPETGFCHADEISNHSFKLRKKNGDFIDVLLSATTERGNDGEAVRSLTVMIDVTELRRTQEELERSNAELQQFAYIASHDLQEPLRMVSSFMQLLQRQYKENLDDKAHQYVEYAVDGANRMSLMINDLLQYSRVKTKGKELSPVDGADALDMALSNLKSAIEDSSAAINVSPLPTVMADRLQLVSLFQNLVGNAIKYGKPGVPPVVGISARQDGRQYVFSISDNGIGIPPEFHERIFSVFQRLHGTESYEGTGIGLAICEKIVTRHGGRIWLESEEGKGATFNFTLKALPES